MEYQVLSFYKYTFIEQPQELQSFLRDLCTTLHLLGRMLIAQEGINASVSGKKENIEHFQAAIQKHPFFGDLTFREQMAKTPGHHKLVIRIRKEIVHFGQPADLQQIGTPLLPEQLQQWYGSNQEFLMIDARNHYEYKIGKFQNAITLPLRTFREFPAASKQLEQFKKHKLVLYCTGGIRCEKASAYLKQQGFPHIYQLQGGIINYLNLVGSAHWQGGLFIFDDRLVEQAGIPLTNCQFCSIPCEQYTNCHNLDCDKLFLSCTSCLRKMNNNCSLECKQAPRQRKEKKLKLK